MAISDMVLVKKLRSTHAQEVQPGLKLGLRAFRSLLVLMPLLGTPHVLLLLAPSRGTLAVVFAYVRAIVLSTQTKNSLSGIKWVGRRWRRERGRRFYT
ncbi:Diuretic hormone receptor [Portunus trituberculatus]|uniref:Diuretic hormone receptor n=1 Tax=Portunus trituberculatus TaxID=210409 RepID=A0A5B7IG52_PORTR|nr:Diuretic hormone receptor [Portunus trituberculatus]